MFEERDFRSDVWLKQVYMRKRAFKVGRWSLSFYWGLRGAVRRMYFQLIAYEYVPGTVTDESFQTFFSLFYFHDNMDLQIILLLNVFS